MLLPKEFKLADRQLLEYLCIIMDKNNMAIAPTQEVSERLELCIKTIYRSLSVLKLHDYIRTRANSVYMVNPEYSSKAEATLRIQLAGIYESLKKEE